MGDIREAFEDAFDQVEGAEEAVAEIPQEVITDDEPQAVEDEPQDETPEGEPEPESQGEPEAQDEPEPEAAESKDEPKAELKDSIKAPEDWSPKNRSAWSKIPPEMQLVVAEREQEFKAFKQEAQEAMQVKGFVDDLQGKYAQVLAAEGVSAPQAIQGLFETVAQLRIGSPAQKAQTLKNIIHEYGIDPQSLNVATGGEMTPEQQQQSEIDRLVQERMAPMQQMFDQMQNAQQQQQHQSVQTAQSEVQQFAESAEFINDVRNDMADLFDMAAAKGITLTLEDAYNKACAMNPEISDILQQRQMEKLQQQAAEELQGKKQAASTLAGKQHGIPSVDNSAFSLRDTLLNAWEE